ncbi:epimerase [Anaerocolumna cellulosilytica]|uniref:Epimerase n=1 Tax=Anaerocolumna cellulosilytica TaxID=433286 RepID=A0A6S6QS03_9FIRM|nr:NAD-dependent epimerase/dehydratase family protein [Anaerocolumna cellulosilytica]MBB5194439.1 UDP-glucose 4-epimerase [Anaerocolumna cellulosilytica]BCJ93384.1 epimerase [Anaerocolumna cellulosilytica]
MKTCLVLGAGGFIGKNLCKQLSKKYRIVAYDIFRSSDLEGIDNLEMVKGNYIETQDFTEILTGVDIVFHLISTTIPSEDTDNIEREIIENVVPTVRLLNNMVKCGVKDIIFFSSGGTIYGETGNHINQVSDKLNPICSYGVQKKTIESYLEFFGRCHDINYKIVRISNPYGIGQDPTKPQGVIPIFIYKLLNNEPITVYGDGNNERDYIYMDDLIDALLKVSEYNGEQHIFNVGSGKAHTLHDIIDIIIQKSGMNFTNIIYKDIRKCDVSKTLLDIGETESELNWVPQVDIEMGISKVLDYYSIRNI